MSTTRIAHIDTAASPDAVDGVTSNLWLLCSEEARRGLDVTLFSRTATDDATHTAARRAGFSILDTPHGPRSVNPRALAAALAACTPDLVHFHGSWQPHHGVAGYLVRRSGVPYVYAPYGGLAPVVLDSRRSLRRAYMAALETPLARGAAGLAPSFATEMSDITAVVGDGWTGPRQVLSPPVPASILDSDHPPSERDPSRVLYLGRYDIFHKGLDRLVEVASHLPDITFELHGAPDPQQREQFDALRRAAPENVTFGDPVFGDDKEKALGSAGAYIQLSRFEGFPTSVAEALCSGLPAIVSSDLGIAGEISDAEVGLVLDSDPQQAADRLRGYLGDAEALSRAGRRAARFGRDTFAVEAVVDRQIELYGDVLGRELSFGPPHT